MDKAAILAGTSPDYGIQDLYNAIASGNPVSHLNCNSFLDNYGFVNYHTAVMDNVHSSDDIWTGREMAVQSIRSYQGALQI